MTKKKLYARILAPGRAFMSWSPRDRSLEQDWYEIEREAKSEAGEYLEYDAENDCIVIKKREKSAEQAEAERRVAIKRQLVDELPDIILQSKDNPEALAQALCNRAKQIEVENETGRDTEVF